MLKSITMIAVLGSAVALAGCTQPAGTGALSERYGEAVAFNSATQVAYKNPEDFLIALDRLFAAETQNTVTFAFNKANLDRTARKALDGQAAWLRAHPEVRMTITGHTDAVGAEAYNDRLGLRRAKAALRYLVRRGVSASRLDAVESRGESELLVETENRERRNRRAVTQVAGFVRNYVGTGMEGELAQILYDVYQANEVEVREAESEADN